MCAALLLAARAGSAREIVIHAGKLIDGSQKNIAEAYKAGVKIAFGTDQLVVPHGRNAEELALLVKMGISPIDAILSATQNAASLLGRSGDVGSVQAGRFADIIAVAGDPPADITELQRVTFVMKGGEVVKK